MVANHGAHIVDVNGLHAQTAADLTGHKFSVLQTVTVADEHRLTGGVDGSLKFPDSSEAFFHQLHNME